MPGCTENVIPQAEVLLLDAGSDRPDAVSAALADPSIHVRHVRSADAALDAAREMPSDLILIDARSPGFDALAACRALRASSSPLLLIGAAMGGDAIAAARASGATDVLPGPFDAALLRLRVDTLLTLSRAQTLQRGTSELLASRGHEIRTPMTAILGMSHLALQEPLDAKPRNYIEKVQHAAESLLATLNDILDFSNIGAGKLELRHHAFQLADVLDGVARQLAQKAEDKGLTLLVDARADLPATLVGDSARLRQVLMDLGTHAIASLDAGDLVFGVERVALSPAGTPGVALRFTLRGAAPLELPRSDASAAAGLETAISAHLITLMGASLSALGGGLSFSVGFDSAGGVETPLAAALPGPGTRALIVEARPGAARILQSMCRSLGLDAELCADGWDAMRQVALARQAGRPHGLVLIDAQLPGMDGAECASWLSRSDAAPPLLLLLTSAAGRDDLTRRLAAQQVVVRSVLVWPPTPSLLRAAAAAALQGGASVPNAAPASDAELLRLHRARLRGARLLLVEDNPIIQELALELLGSAGIEVTLAENGQAALDCLAAKTFDGVLMDCQMPVMDGFEATRALRAQPRLRDLPVIALTADTLGGDRDRVIKAGMNDHIGKPFEVGQMFSTLSSWIRPGADSAPPPTASPNARAGDDPIARLPGIDASVGRRSTMGNEALYRKLLRMFHAGQRNFEAQFRAARAEGDHATAMRLAHNLRAVSGSLGALSLQHAASALEHACASEAGDTVIAALLATAVTDLDAVMGGLRELAA